jgi:8-oxo-dGTP diphosphatase
MTKTYFAVTGIIIYEGKFLILKKSPDDYNYPNHWSFCSGFVKEFEAGEDTLLREVKEETGLEAEIVKEGEIVHVRDKTNGKNWIILPFLCSVKSNQVTLDHENSEFRWITKGQIPEFKFVPGLIEDLKSVGLL